MEPASARKETGAEHPVLWVEGHRDNREFLAIFLAQAGYSVTSCDSIRQAAKAARDRQFDVYIVGDCLPFGSNLPLAAEISSANPRAPLILYSALAFANDVERGIQTGAQAYITKPGNLDHLLATINGLLARDDSRPADSGGRTGRAPCRRGSAKSLTREDGKNAAEAESSKRIVRPPAVPAKKSMRPRQTSGRVPGPHLTQERHDR